MKDAIELNIKGIKCDNPECDFRDDGVQVEDYDKTALKMTIDSCKGYLYAIQEFCNKEEYGLADITRGKLQEEIDELEGILEVMNMS